MRFTQPTLPEAWMPSGYAGSPSGTVNYEPLVVGQPVRLRSAHETTVLPEVRFPWPNGLADIFDGHRGSAMGFHAIAETLTCPTRRMLYRMGVHRKGSDRLINDKGVLDKKAFGTLIHTLLALRVIYGPEEVRRLLVASDDGVLTSDHSMLKLGPIGKDLPIDDLSKSYTILKVYDQEHPLVGPLAEKGFRYLCIEREIATDIGDGHGGSCLRTVIYDAVVQPYDQKIVFSLEKKTTSRSGSGAMDPYMPQFASQCALWNANPALVATYGPMVGVIPDTIVKTTVPKCERHLPRYITRYMQHAITHFMRLPDQIRYPVEGMGYGGFPQMLHACWGRFDPCDYIPLCWEGVHGDYEWPEGSPEATAP